MTFHGGSPGQHSTNGATSDRVSPRSPVSSIPTNTGLAT
jgi:hypothetical protein